ncbi:MAG: mandelate racemase/muconate lactonizing protein [Luteitalea sp.]|nr:mandelate racemase/muconate lactonizing protein [Luteitalea sp.]
MARIVSIEAVPHTIDVNRALAIVSAAGSHPVSRYVLVHVHTDERATGIGEANVVPAWSGESQAGAVAVVEELFTPLLVGQDPRHVARLSDAIDLAIIGNPFTKAAIEMALLDAAAKLLGVPANLLLGGARRTGEIPLKASIGAFSPSEAARVAEWALAQGFRAAKVKVGLSVPEDLERVGAVRAAVGDDFPLGVDANAGWTEQQVVAALPGLERLGVNVIEEPLRRRDFRGCARLRQRSSIPIMLDESVFTPQDGLDAIRADACDLISVYPGKNGGIRRSLEIASLAAAAGLRCVIGSNLEWDIATAAMLHLAVTMPALSPIIHHDIIGPLYHTRRVGEPLIRFDRGHALLPEGIGLGVSL